MSTIEIVALVVAVLVQATKWIGFTKDAWSRVPVLAHYIPGAFPVVALLVEKFQGVKTENDLMTAGLALGLLALGHFTKSKEAPKV